MSIASTAYAPAAQPRDPAIPAHWEQMASRSSENFTVMSRLVPAALRADFGVVYAFCRLADDLADEHDGSEAARDRALDDLALLRARLRRCVQEGASPEQGRFFAALGRTIRERQVPPELFERLLDAFEQDQRVTRYRTWDELLDYCTRSADPVGRIVLHVLGEVGPSSRRPLVEQELLLVASDAICTGLQLANFWQDVRRDLLDRDRIYLPSELGAGEAELRDWLSKGNDPRVRKRYALEVESLCRRTRACFDRGRALPAMLGGPSGWLIWTFLAAGDAVLDSIASDRHATLWRRPRVGKVTRTGIVARAMISRALGLPVPGR